MSSRPFGAHLHALVALRHVSTHEEELSRYTSKSMLPIEVRLSDRLVQMS